jgi:hypothetical protein
MESFPRFGESGGPQAGFLGEAAIEAPSDVVLKAYPNFPSACGAWTAEGGCPYKDLFSTRNCALGAGVKKNLSERMAKESQA